MNPTTQHPNPLKLTLALVVVKAEIKAHRKQWHEAKKKALEELTALQGYLPEDREKAAHKARKIHKRILQEKHRIDTFLAVAEARKERLTLDLRGVC